MPLVLVASSLTWWQNIAMWSDICQLYWQLFARPVGVTKKCWRLLFLLTDIMNSYFPELLSCSYGRTCGSEEHLTLLVTCPLFAAAEWDDKEPDGRAVLAGGPHQARLQRRRTVLPGEPSNAVHSLPQRGQCAALTDPRPHKDVSWHVRWGSIYHIPAVFWAQGAPGVRAGPPGSPPLG